MSGDFSIVPFHLFGGKGPASLGAQTTRGVEEWRPNLVLSGGHRCDERSTDFRARSADFKADVD